MKWSEGHLLRVQEAVAGVGGGGGEGGGQAPESRTQLLLNKYALNEC